jgi:hypothetical protein
MAETTQNPIPASPAAPTAPQPAKPVLTPFAFRDLHGTRDGVLKAVAGLVTPGRNSDQAQIENAKKLIASEISELPESVKAVKVTVESKVSGTVREIHVWIIDGGNLLI